MSHSPLRKETDCLNCGATVQGRFCHVCGQENLEPKESFWHLVSHFFNDITHFDGKFFITLKDLLFKPGFLSKEYVLGKRASYLNPIRMYVFTSAIFFLIFFSFNHTNEVPTTTTINGKTLAAIDTMSAASFAIFTANINKGDKKPALPMSREEFKRYSDSVIRISGLSFTGMHYKSIEEYDSLLSLGIRKDNWFQRQLVRKQIELNKKYNNNPSQISEAFTATLLHSLPQMLFLSLPLLALILKLIYARRKQFYYVSHGIFSIHLYVFLFIGLLFLFGISEMNDRLHWGVLDFISTLLIIGLFVYEYLALKNFYQQKWFKTFLKFLLLNILLFVVVILLFAIFTLLSFLKI